MPADKYGVGPDKDWYSGSGVLVNLLGIEDGTALAEAEVAFTQLRLEQYDYPMLQEFSLQTWKNIHFYLFQDVYVWAGELRSVDISKGMTRFATLSRIEPEANKLFSALQQERYLVGLPRRQFVERAAYYFGELNVIHPFREGNGRAQRLLFENLAIGAGYQFRWNLIDASLWIPANEAAFYGRPQLLTDLFEQAVSEIPP
jgi:cell filamentation protein